MLANPSWINKGVVGSSYGSEGILGGAVLADSKSDVVSLHPAVVHIMLGADDATTDDGRRVSASHAANLFWPISMPW